MRKPDKRQLSMLAGALIVAAATAALLATVTHEAGFSTATVREGALNGASLGVAFLLVAGLTRKQKKKGGK